MSKPDGLMGKHVFKDGDNAKVISKHGGLLVRRVDQPRQLRRLDAVDPIPEHWNGCIFKLHDRSNKSMEVNG